MGKSREDHWEALADISHRWSLVPLEVRDQYVSGQKTDTAPVIDLLSHGYAKLLGKGKKTPSNDAAHSRAGGG